MKFYVYIYIYYNKMRDKMPRRVWSYRSKNNEKTWVWDHSSHHKSSNCFYWDRMIKEIVVALSFAKHSMDTCFFMFFRRKQLQLWFSTTFCIFLSILISHWKKKNISPALDTLMIDGWLYQQPPPVILQWMIIQQNHCNLFMIWSLRLPSNPHSYGPLPVTRTHTNPYS